MGDKALKGGVMEEDLKRRLEYIHEIILGTDAQGDEIDLDTAWSHDSALNEIVRIANIEYPFDPYGDES